MRLKHLLNLKQNEQQPLWMYIATYWLAKDIRDYSKYYNYLKNNNRVKTTNQKAPCYYRDLIQYVKTQYQNIPKLKTKTKTIYKSILQKGSQDHIILGETLWKNRINNLDFNKIWKNTTPTANRKQPT